jgi:hypothetical protein
MQLLSGSILDRIQSNSCGDGTNEQYRIHRTYKCTISYVNVLASNAWVILCESTTAKCQYLIWTQSSLPVASLMPYRLLPSLPDIKWVHTCNVTAYRNTLSWQCVQDSWPRNVSKVGYVVALRACSVCCRYLAVASNGMIRLRPEQVWTCNVTLHVQTCSGCNRIIPLMRRPNTDSTPNNHVTLPRYSLLIRYAVTNPVHTVTIRCYDTR